MDAAICIQDIPLPAEVKPISAARFERLRREHGGGREIRDCRLPVWAGAKSGQLTGGRGSGHTGGRGGGPPCGIWYS